MQKLNIGDLEGNRFKINLHNVEIEDINHIQKIHKDYFKRWYASRLPHIFQTNALTKGFPIFKGHYFL
jgi:protein tyrosine phosphatase